MDKITNRIFKYITLGLYGGAVYWCIEMAWRGFSHWSMFILGGICFVLIGGINNYLPWKLGIVWQAVIGAVIITILELPAGLILNVWLDLGIWCYADLPFNIMGQISLPFTLIWIPLAAVGVFLDDFLRWKIYGEQKPKYTWF